MTLAKRRQWCDQSAPDRCVRFGPVDVHFRQPTFAIECGSLIETTDVSLITLLG